MGGEGDLDVGVVGYKMQVSIEDVAELVSPKIV